MFCCHEPDQLFNLIIRDNSINMMKKEVTRRLIISLPPPPGDNLILLFFWYYSVLNCGKPIEYKKKKSKIVIFYRTCRKNKNYVHLFARNWNTYFCAIIIFRKTAFVFKSWYSKAGDLKCRVGYRLNTLGCRVRTSNVCVYYYRIRLSTKLRFKLVYGNGAFVWECEFLEFHS